MQSSDGSLGLLAVCAFIFLICMVLLHLRVSLKVRQLLCGAVILRVVGAQLYYFTFQYAYRGGDYLTYYYAGLQYAYRMARGDFSMFTNPAEWKGAVWHGTQFVFYPASILLSLIGPSLLGACFVFALLGLLGLVGFAIAFHRASPGAPVERYLLWLVLFPSLWFWPATLGKDALLLMGLGLSVWGSIGKRGRIQWPILALGIFFVFAIRPQVASVVVASLVVGQMLAKPSRSKRRLVQNIALVVCGFWIVQMGLQSIGAGMFDTGGMADYVNERAATTAVAGRSAVDIASGPVGALVGLVNVLFRPLPWEAHNVPNLISSMEIWGFWLLLWLHRRNALLVLRQVRSNRLVSIGVPFVLLYATTLGMSLGNMGIIARQRIFLFPFLFLLFVDVSQRRRPDAEAPSLLARHAGGPLEASA